MKKSHVCAACATAILCLVALLVVAQDSNAEGEAKEVIDDLFEAFNNRNSDGYYATFHYPQVSIGPTGSLRVSEGPPKAGMNFDGLTQREGWHHSVLVSATVLDSSTDKVHFDVRFTRHKNDGSAYGRYSGLWSITRKDGQWGIQARSFMPTESL